MKKILYDIVEEAIELADEPHCVHYVARLAASLAVRRARYDHRVVEAAERRLAYVSTYVVFTERQNTVYGPFTSASAEEVVAAMKTSGRTGRKILIEDERGEAGASGLRTCVFRSFDDESKFSWTHHDLRDTQYPLLRFWN